jgi:hypothetical protein
MDIALPSISLPGDRLQRMSYERLRRDGFQDVERLGKQYAALNSSRLWAPCPKNSTHLPKRIVTGALFSLIEPCYGATFAILDIKNVTRQYALSIVR